MRPAVGGGGLLDIDGLLSASASALAAALGGGLRGPLV